MSSLDAVRARFARNEGLPFADILTEANIRAVLNEHGITFRDRVFNPVTTIWGFLGQVLSEDHSCRDAVSRIIAHRASNGKTVCSPNTASYCNARSRILTDVLRTLATRTAEELQANIADQWKWNNRSVFIFDGSSVSMPDTPENQAVYPQPPAQQPGLGFPLARIGVLLSLATGACHNLAMYEPDEIDALVKALKGLQNVLGDFNDYSVHRDYLGELAPSLPPGLELALGALRERLRLEQEREREAFEERFERFAGRENLERAERLFGKRRRG